MSSSKTGWTNDRVNILRKLWLDGISASKIASRLGGITRNAVIGKVHRLKLKRTTAYPPKPKESNGTASYDALPKKQHLVPRIIPRVTQMDQLAIPVSPPIEQEEMLGVHLGKLTGCKFPIDRDTEGHLFCNKRRKKDAPYCEEHCVVAYQPVRGHKRRGISVTSRRELAYAWR